MAQVEAKRVASRAGERAVKVALNRWRLVPDRRFVADGVAAWQCVQIWHEFAAHALEGNEDPNDRAGRVR